MVYRLTVDKRGSVSLPREALEAIGVADSGFVKLSPCGDHIVIERVHLQVASPQKRQV